MPEPSCAADIVFSPDELRRRCLENLELAQRVVRAFLTHGEQELASLELLAASGQADETAKGAHRFKGASDNVAARRLCRLAAALEQSARAGAPDLMQQVQSLRMEWGQFQQVAEEYLLPARAVPLVSRPD